MADDDEYSRDGHNQAAGHLSGLRQACELVMERAATAYRKGRDDEANTLRQVGRVLEGYVSKAETELRRFIALSQKERR